MSATSEIGSAWKAAAASKASGGGGGGDKESGSGDSRDEVVQLDGTSFSMYYGQLQHQQNMLQDWVRTGMYQYAFSQNAADFSGATVMDVGTGTGLLASSPCRRARARSTPWRWLKRRARCSSRTTWRA